jgi:hypothetical protein
MSGKLITKLLAELGTLNYKGRVVLYVYNEPMLHPDLYGIIAECRELVPKSCIMVATNGDYVSDEANFKDMFVAGLNQLQVNVYSKNRKEYLMKFVKELHWTIEEGNIYSNIGHCKQVYSVEDKWEITGNKVGRFELSNRSGNIDFVPKMAHPIKSTCVRPFRSMQINWRGEVILCCNDYHGDVIMGNVNKAGLIDIWEGLEFTEYRLLLQAKDRNLALCDVCSFKGGAYKHMLEKV